MNFPSVRMGALAGSMTRSMHGAALTFSKVVADRVGMSVLDVALVDRGGLEGSLHGLDRYSGGRLCMITQRMRTADDLHTQGMLVLPEEGARLIVRRMLGLPVLLGELSELEQDALSELGSIVIDACRGGLGGAFGLQAEAAQPAVDLTDAESGFSLDDTLHNALVTQLHIHLSGLRVEGRVVLEMVADSALPVLPRYRLSA
ncbi:hypothetical protein METUNv1_03315 [Methyloversatilis universalis FAM5]|uniref:Uncharacterized protein n=1 Tax=Methyloversatilis universalis (strain ATCC BAA-1314 / DSM 25237 / JCM 13912 / CCUG 52030 / FAM5) TaxID=1000565 RepID=F5RGM2_METUF|nr:hypothetical protein [Methyloversatilis universalis]EGK70410.1 hypothetical protein METUNv1_03315 [Methyloversatilis universalis FAM5]